MTPNVYDFPEPLFPATNTTCERAMSIQILFDNEVPVKVAINEAVELAKSFGSENSAKFVNGVLGSVSALASR